MIPICAFHPLASTCFAFPRLRSTYPAQNHSFLPKRDKSNCDKPFFPSQARQAIAILMVALGLMSQTLQIIRLGNNTEVFDAEIFAIYQTINLFEARREEGSRYVVFSDHRCAHQSHVRPSRPWSSLRQSPYRGGREIGGARLLSHLAMGSSPPKGGLRATKRQTTLPKRRGRTCAV